MSYFFSIVFSKKSSQNMALSPVINNIFKQTNVVNVLMDGTVA